MRLFIAVNFSEAVKERILEVQADIRARASRGNFSRRENLHLTLVFLGETPEDRIPHIRSCMETLRDASFMLNITRTGFFSRGGRELWWLGAEEGPGMDRLQEIRRRLCAGLSKADIAFDSRSFNAHITLGREIRFSAPVSPPPISITIPVERISLILSEHRTGAGSPPSHKKTLVYTELYGHTLKAEGA